MAIVCIPKYHHLMSQPSYVLNFLKNHKDHAFTIHQLVDRLNQPKATVNRQLYKLLKMGQVQRVGLTSWGVFDLNHSDVLLRQEILHQLQKYKPVPLFPHDVQQLLPTYYEEICICKELYCMEQDKMVTRRPDFRWTLNIDE